MLQSCLSAMRRHGKPGLLLLAVLTLSGCGKKPADVDAPPGAAAAQRVYPPLDQEP